MKRKTRKNAFTLIELLAVIVILAIIALIAVPVIINIINKANKSAFKDTAYGIISAGELYFAEQQLDINGMKEDKTIDLSTSTELQLKGEIPEGKILITKDGEIALAVSNGRYCITKGINNTDIIVSEDIADCDIKKTLSNLATISTEVTVVPNCIINRTICSAGTPVAVKVNEDEIYNFYVLADDGSKVNLIMNRNLGDNIAWITESDYVNANTDDTACPEVACSDEGPITVVEALKERTAEWTNIPEKEYTYRDDTNHNRYRSFNETMRARMLTYIEASRLGCDTPDKSCPSWLYINLKNTGSDTDDNGRTRAGYWTSSAYAINNAHNIHYYGHVGTGYVHYSTGYGIRPVIELSK